MELKDSYEQYITDYGMYDATLRLLSMYAYKTRPDLHLKWLDGITPMTQYDIESIYEVSELYEYGLAYHDKGSKRSLGQYFTPHDVSDFMSSLIYDKTVNKRIVDPCCGTGNLMIALMSMYKNPWETITHHILLCDVDATAIIVAKTLLTILYAPHDHNVSSDDISSYTGDFLSDGIIINKNDVIIMNPPYGRCDDHNEYETYDIHDMYAMFMEKAALSYAFVSITPQSFIGSLKFEKLRDILSMHRTTDIIAYDNVPGTIFNGRKHGVFNTNESNSVRAAITVSLESPDDGGIRSTPMLRWRNSERDDAIHAYPRIITGIPYENHTKHAIPKCPSTTQWLLNIPHDITLGQLEAKGPISLCIPTTPRYHTTAAKRTLSRSSRIITSYKNTNDAAIAYIIMNSSLAYAWWRIWDGSITLTRRVLTSIPVPSRMASDSIIMSQYMKLTSIEDDYISRKKNAGKQNENISWTDDIIHENNRIIFPQASSTELQALEAFHSNSMTDTYEYWMRK